MWVSTNILRGGTVTLRAAVALMLIVGLTFLTGCSTQYQDASASCRTVGDTTELKNDYLGLSFRFAVDGPPPYHAAEIDTEPFASAQ
jgi:hypothetical protein